jgi:murein DD-endopeptidase MepM/ murein hydrolase activator NlpD
MTILLRTRSFCLVALLILTGSARALAEAPAMTLRPGTVKPGDAFLVIVAGATSPPTGSAGDRPLSFYRAGDTYRALGALPVELAPGPLAVSVRLAGPDDGGVTELTGLLEVRDPQFASRELSVARQFVEPPASVRRRLQRDREAFAKAYDQPFGPPRFRSAFVWPREAETTAPFGDKRVFNGKMESQHYGIDLDGRIGEPVNATEAGEVVLVRDCHTSGLTVLVHHGAGVYSAYFHLSKARVRQGQKIKRGQRLGDVGMSGRVTGPHLHFSIRVDGLYVDPASVVALELEEAR